MCYALIESLISAALKLVAWTGLKVGLVSHSPTARTRHSIPQSTPQGYLIVRLDVTNMFKPPGHRCPFGKIDGPGTWNNTVPSMLNHSNQKRTPMLPVPSPSFSAKIEGLGGTSKLHSRCAPILTNGIARHIHSVAFCSPAKKFNCSEFNGKPISWQKVKVLTSRQHTPKFSICPKFQLPNCKYGIH